VDLDTGRGRTDRAHSMTETRLRALPVQILETEGGLELVRGGKRLNIEGSRGLAAAIQEILARADVPDGAARDALLTAFPAPDRAAVGRLLDALAAHGFLVDPARGPGPDGETESDVFYWEFGLSGAEAQARLGAAEVLVLGVNAVSAALARSLADAGVARVRVLDVPYLRNLRWFDDAGAPAHWPAELPQPEGFARLDALDLPADGVVAGTSDFGGAHALRGWNELCVRRGVRFLPVVLQQNLGSVGPLVVPGESPCYECLRARENANMDAPAARRAPEYRAFEGQLAAGCHPAMPAILGQLAGLEISMLAALASAHGIGHVIECDFQGTRMTRRRVLKLPYCQVCSELVQQPGDAVAVLDL
jgi:bacteriocin biosynthesis cyclodehydratase domain-containing protein